MRQILPISATTEPNQETLDDAQLRQVEELLYMLSNFCMKNAFFAWGLRTNKSLISGVGMFSVCVHVSSERAFRQCMYAKKKNFSMWSSKTMFYTGRWCIFDVVPQTRTAQSPRMRAVQVSLKLWCFQTESSRLARTSSGAWVMGRNIRIIRKPLWHQDAPHSLLKLLNMQEKIIAAIHTTQAYCESRI